MDNIKIAHLNDDFRHHPSKGTVILTEGICSNTKKDIAEIMACVRNYDAFTENNDPYGEHDFGSFDFKGNKILWKIDYYDQNFLYISPEPSNPRLTNRVLTVMCADEY